MIRILIAGAGQIGTTIAHLLSSLSGYRIFLIDCQLSHVPQPIKNLRNIQMDTLDINDPDACQHYLRQHKIQGIVSCLPYFLSKKIADLAQATNIHYFDLTEDIGVTDYVKKISVDSKSAFVSQCGLAPGLVNIIANDLMRHFDELDTVKIRCGGLPKITSNELKYAFTWSVDGLINEYNRPCPAIESGQFTYLTPLANTESIQIDGLSYEAFNTSGGIGSLTETYSGKVQYLNYKSIRYPGHSEKIRFLMQDLKLGQDVEMLKKILLNAIPYTTEDVVIVYITVTGTIRGKFERKSFVNKYYSQTIDTIHYSALQLTTASSASTVIDSVMRHPTHYQGYIRQEQFTFHQIENGPFVKYLKDSL